MSEHMSEKQELEEWSYVFKILGMEGVREILYEVSMRLDVYDDPRVVIEFFDSPQGYQALEITEHFNSLEGIAPEDDE